MHDNATKYAAILTNIPVVYFYCFDIKIQIAS